MSVKQIRYKNKTIFVSDNSGLESEDVINNQNKLLDLLKKEKNNDALTITDMTNVIATPKVDRVLKEIGNEILEHSRKAALIGMEKGVKKILIKPYMNISSKPMKIFSNIEDAKNWLAED